MLRSVLQKNKKGLFLTVAALTCLLHYSFTPAMDEQEMLTWTNNCLAASYDPSGDDKLKTWQLTLTADGFIRLRKTYARGKEEFHSFHLSRFSDMGYLGTTTSGTLQLKAVADDIIVQTFNDPSGDIDSMATQLNIPVRGMEPDRLDSLQMALNYFKKKGL